jgi:hypothetical protein
LPRPAPPSPAWPGASVSDATVARWLAEAGLLPPDPGIDHRRLEKLYVDQVLTIAEVAEKLRISPARVSRELVVAGIPDPARHRPVVLGGTGPRSPTGAWSTCT